MYRESFSRKMFCCFIPVLLLSFPIPAISQNHREQIRIAVADFTGPDPETIPVTETLFNWLGRAGEQVEELSVTRLNYPITADSISEHTINELIHDDLDILIYGSYDIPATRVQLTVSALILSEASDETPLNIYLGDDASFLLSEFVPGTNPPDKIRFILNSIAAYYLLSENYNDGSWEYLNRALDLEESVSDYLLAYTYSLRSMAYLGIGNPVSALEDADRAIILDPSNPLQFSFKGAALEKMGRFAEALDAYLIVNELEAENAENLYNISRMYLQLGDVENSMNSIDEAIRLSPDEPCYLNSRGYTHNYTQQYSKAIDDISKALELNPEYATGWANLACAQRQLGHTADAIESFSRAVSFQEDRILQGSYLLDRGYCYTQLHDYESAIRDYTEGIALSGGRASNHAHLGWLLMETENYESALTSLNTAIQQEPSNPDFLCRRAFCNYNLGNPQQSVDDYTEAFLIDPEGFDDYEYLGKASKESGDPVSAIACFTAGIETSGNPGETAWLFSYRGLCHREVGNYQSAIADFSTAVEILPEEPFMHFRLGETLYLADRDGEAVRWFTSAIEKGLASPWFLGCLFQRGRAHIILGSYDLAVEDLTEVLNARPDYADAYYFRGKAFFLSGNYQGCQQNMEEYLRVGTNPDLLARAQECLSYIEQ